MPSVFAPTIALFIPLSMIAACGGDDSSSGVDAPPGDPADASHQPDASHPPDASGDSLTVTGTAVPELEPSPVMAFWSVFTGSDYLYKFGEGTTAFGTFSLSITDTPPDQARVQIGPTDFGVATLVAFPDGTTIPDGVVAKFPGFTGIAGRFGVVYRGPGDPGTQPAWLAAFPIGFSCGACVDSASGFDSFAPAACDAFVIEDLSSDVCNWY